jgi:DNA-binding response OmpR family regulator
MSMRRHVLVVSQNPRTANTLIAWLSPAGYELSIVNTFSAAKVHLNARPDLLITELKLQEYNGLHLALRAHALGTPSIILGSEDPVLAKDAFELGATYLSALPSRVELVKIVGDVLLSSQKGSADGLVAGAASTQGELMWNYVSGPKPTGVDQAGRRLLLH